VRIQIAAAQPLTKLHRPVIVGIEVVVTNTDVEQDAGRVHDQSGRQENPECS